MQERYEIDAYHLIANTPEEIKVDRFCGRVTDNIN